MKLTKNFWLAEFTRSQTAARKNIDNNPSEEIIEHLTKTARQLELVRELLDNNAIIISSGYRCLELNLAIGGSATSAHMNGWAADFTCSKFGTPEEVWEFLQDSEIDFDQLILEFGQWIHISFDPQMRGQSFKIG